MDLFYQGITHFCLVAGDSDYVPLVQRLRQDACTVLVIGTAAVSTALQEASSLFVSTDHLLPKVSAAPPVSSALSCAPVPASPAQSAALSTLLTEAYTLAAQQSGTEWVLFSTLGATLRRCHADFEMTYGKQSLSKLVQQCPECFETQKRSVGKGEVEEVRLRKAASH